MYHGIINVYKEAGYTSHDVVAKLRGICRQKKIGHTGTLDPDAVGVLPVCLGSATRVCDMLTDKNKEYEAVFRLGMVTDTQDISGQVMESHPELAVNITPHMAESAIFSFLGSYDQIPPMYSALKVDGKKLYELARAGKEVERAARRVEILQLSILQMELPKITIRVGCSKGTYIRTLCHDIGQKLGCGAAMVSLKRTRVGEFRVEQALTLAEITELAAKDQLETVILPIDLVFGELHKITVLEEYQKYLENGNKIPVSQILQNVERVENVESVQCVQNADSREKKEYLSEVRQEECPDRKQSLWKDQEQVRVYNYAHHFYGVFSFEKQKMEFKPVKMFFTER